ncbi:MAG: sodium:solute symporter family protein [Lautropia sp.]
MAGHLVDIAIVASFVALGIASGLRARRSASRSLDDYFLAGRSVSGWRAGLSMAATQYAADTPLLVTGLVALGGIWSLWQLWVYGLAFLLLGFVLGGAWRRAGVLTDAQLTAQRYSGRGVLALRVFKAIYYGTVINCVVMAFVLLAATRLFDVFLPWHAWLAPGLHAPLVALFGSVGAADTALSMALILGFVALYSTTGGLRSVISTDVMQFVVMLVGTGLYALFAVRAAGGLEPMLASVERLYGEARASRMLGFLPPAGDALLPFLAVISMQWLFQVNSDGTGYLAQRTMACASDRQARIAALVFTLAQVLVRSLLWLPIAIALLVLYPFDPDGPREGLAAARELGFVQGIDDWLPAGARGLMLTGMLAALASTIDTHLNWGASYWSNDLYKALWVERIRRREASARELVLVARISTLVVLAIAIAIMTHLDSIQRAWQVSLLFGAGIGGVLVLRWLWEKVNLQAEIASMAVSIVLAPVLLATVDAFWLQLLAMSVASTLAVVVAARLGPPTDPALLAAFYRRVRPPGFWRESAIAAGDAPSHASAELRRSLAAVAAASLTVYGLLLGLGLMMVDRGSPAAWTASIAVAVVAIPFWWRRV